MCVLFDANIIPVVFSSKNSRHEKYKCILEWFIYGKPKMVIGGYYFTKEISKSLRSYLPFFLELSKLNKTHMFRDSDIDSLAEELARKETDADFDDPHLLALLIFSKATIFCSEDSRSYRFIQDKKFYPKGQAVPKIFTLAEHDSCRELLDDRSICGNGTHDALSKSIADRLMARI